MTHVTSHAGVCPAKYLKLRSKLLSLIESKEGQFLHWLREHVRETYPELHKKCFVPPTFLNGRPAGKGVFLITRLYDLLGIALNKNCIECNKPTGFNKKTFVWRDFCSVKCSANSARTRDIYKKTCNKKWGADNFRSSKRGKAIIKKVLHEIYGGHHLQTSEVYERVKNSQHRTKEFVSSNGDVHKCQGYEPFVLEMLDANDTVYSYTTETQKIPVIPYTLNGKCRKYFPDVAIKLKDGRRILVEVKSPYTLTRDKEVLRMNLAKFRAAESECRQHKGWSFWLALVTPDGEITWTRNPSTRSYA